jgi:hypothetical protein
MRTEDGGNKLVEKFGPPAAVGSDTADGFITFSGSVNSSAVFEIIHIGSTKPVHQYLFQETPKLKRQQYIQGGTRGF